MHEWGLGIKARHAAVGHMYKLSMLSVALLLSDAINQVLYVFNLFSQGMQRVL